jgi:hypothetical protein
MGIEYHDDMPTISMFYGILIRMYLGKNVLICKKVKPNRRNHLKQSC